MAGVAHFIAGNKQTFSLCNLWDAIAFICVKMISKYGIICCFQAA